ncbi:MAG TPA: hypothetical protein VJY62_21410 [Bacteroidia bacterium]|nr:hypothetical protein [Bacteroidia bacterium]
MVEVFKTTVGKKYQAKRVLKELSGKFPHFKINFDLNDCDKILRVEGTKIKSPEIIRALKVNGYQCEVLI